MATEGFLGYSVETRDYTATAALWKSLGYENVFDTDHGSGQWRHPNGGPYILIAEQHDKELRTHPILQVADSASFAPKAQTLNFDRAFEPQHWGVVEAMVLDPDGREVSLQAPQ